MGELLGKVLIGVVSGVALGIVSVAGAIIAVKVFKIISPDIVKKVTNKLPAVENAKKQQEMDQMFAAVIKKKEKEQLEKHGEVTLDIFDTKYQKPIVTDFKIRGETIDDSIQVNDVIII